MKPNWIGVITVVLTIVTFFFTYRYAIGKAVKKRWWWFFLSVLLALPAASFTIYYTHIFPEYSWYYEFRSLPGTELLMIFVGIAGGLIATLISRKLLVFPLLAVVLLALVPFVKPLMGPLAKGRMADLWSGEVCLQSTLSTCGAASGATVAKALGVEVTEVQLASEAYSYQGGTEAWYLARALRSRGLQLRFRMGLGLEHDIVFPAIAGVRLAKAGHFIALLGMEGEDFRIGDPLMGEELLSREVLLKRYEFTGFYMELSKQ